MCKSANLEKLPIASIEDSDHRNEITGVQLPEVRDGLHAN